MKNKKRVRRISIVLACILVPLGALGFGYFVGGDNKENQVAHTLTIDGSIEGTVVNTQEANTDGIVPGDTVAKTINIKPNATASSLLRVKIEPSWYDGESKTDLSASNIEFIYANNIVKSDFTTSGNDYWYKNNDDGYLYYMDSVTTRDEAMKLVEGIKFTGGDGETDAKEYQGKNLKITVTMDMIQCKYAPYKTKWGIEKDSTLYNKLKDLCPNANEHIE